MEQNKSEVDALVRAQGEVDNVYGEWERERDTRRRKAALAWAAVQDLEMRRQAEVGAVEEEAVRAEQEESAAFEEGQVQEPVDEHEEQGEEGELSEERLGAAGLPPALLGSLAQLCSTVCEGLVTAGLMQEEVATAAGLLLERGDEGVVQAVLEFVDMNEADSSDEDAYVDALGTLVRALTMRVHAVASAFQHDDHDDHEEDAEAAVDDAADKPAPVTASATSTQQNASASAPAASQAEEPHSEEDGDLESSTLTSDDVMMLLWVKEDPVPVSELVEMYSVYAALCGHEGKEAMSIEQWAELRRRARAMSQQQDSQQ